MLDRPRSTSAVDLPFSGANWRHRRLYAVSGRLCQVLDITILSAVFLVLVMLPVFGRKDSALHGLLQWRVSLRNVLLGVMCLSTWGVLLMSVGMYRPERTRSLPDYIFRCIIGLNSCTAVVGLIEVVLHAKLDAWHFVELYWLACLLSMTSARVVLLLFDRGLRSR